LQRLVVLEKCGSGVEPGENWKPLARCGIGGGLKKKVPWGGKWEPTNSWEHGKNRKFQEGHEEAESRLRPGGGEKKKMAKNREKKGLSGGGLVREKRDTPAGNRKGVRKNEKKRFQVGVHRKRGNRKKNRAGEEVENRLCGEGLKKKGKEELSCQLRKELISGVMRDEGG